MLAITLPARFFALVLLLATSVAPARALAAAKPAATPAPAMTLYGGGADIAEFGVAAPTGHDPHAGFGFFETVSRGYGVSYCATGSGFGTAVFIGTVAAAGPCAPRSARPTGFGAPPDRLDFAVSATPLSTHDARIFARNATTVGNPLFGRGEPVQIPVLATSVAIVYRNPDVGERLNLSVDSLCRIADGEITDWSQIPLDPRNPAGAHFPPRPLRFVYRSDRSGVTFALANFLSATDAYGVRRTCTRAGETFALSDVFDPRDTTDGEQAASGTLPAPLPAGAETARFLGARGEAAALACVSGDGAACRAAGRPAAALGADGTIGYASGPAAAATAALRPGVGIAALYVVRDGIGTAFDPVLDVPDAATAVRGYVTGRVIGDFRPNARPAVELEPLDGPHAACNAVVPPSEYAFPAAGYPIVSLVYFDFTTAGNGTRAAAVRGLATVLDNSRQLTRKRVRSLDRDNAITGMTGYSVLPLPLNRKTGVPAIAACIGK